MSRMKEIQPAAGILTPGPRSALAAFRVFADRFKMPTLSLPEIAGSRLALMRAWKIERTPLICAWERFAGPDTALGALRHALAGLAEWASTVAEPRGVARKG